MAKRVGYTADLEVTQDVLEKKFKNTRNWQSTRPFKSKKEAADWEAEAMKELGCKGDGPGQKQRRPNDPWYGYIFEHDGPK